MLLSIFISLPVDFSKCLRAPAEGTGIEEAVAHALREWSEERAHAKMTKVQGTK